MSKDNKTHVPNPLAEVLEDTLSQGVRGEREIKGIVVREVVKMVTDGFGFGCGGGGGGNRG